MSVRQCRLRVSVPGVDVREDAGVVVIPENADVDVVGHTVSERFVVVQWNGLHLFVLPRDLTRAAAFAKAR